MAFTLSLPKDPCLILRLIISSIILLLFISPILLRFYNCSKTCCLPTKYPFIYITLQVHGVQIRSIYECIIYLFCSVSLVFRFHFVANLLYFKAFIYIILFSSLSVVSPSYLLFAWSSSLFC